MNDGVLVQFAEGPLHLSMLDVVQSRHEAYGRRHGFDLRRIAALRDAPAVLPPSGFVPISSALGFARWKLVRDALEQYEYVALLETDTMIEDGTADLRAATADRPLAMVYAQCSGGEPLHYQTGVIYARRHPELSAFLDAIMALCPPEDVPEESILWWWRQHCQQVVANQLLHQVRWAGLVARLDLRWNDAFGSPGVIVRAWHGVSGERNKLEAMRAHLQRLPAIR